MDVTRRLKRLASKRHKPAQERSGDREASQESSDGGRLIRVAAGFGILASIAAVVTLLLGVTSNSSGDNTLQPQTATYKLPPREPKLRNIDVAVLNGPTGKPRVEVILHNVGTGRSIVTRASFRILHVAELTECFTQGGMSLSNDYDVILPPNPTPGESITIPVHEQLAGDEADRFALSLAESSETAAGQQTYGKAHLYVFQLALSIHHDGDPVPDRLGNVVISVPTIPQLEGYFLTKAMVSPAGRAQRLESWGPTFFSEYASCWRENALELEQILALPGERSQELTQETSEMVVLPARR